MIYPLYTLVNCLDIKETTETSTFAYLDFLLSVTLSTMLYDKGDYFDFRIINFPYSKQYISLQLMVFISRYL